MITKSVAINNYLKLVARPDLSNLYSLNMECQVNVAQDGGERINGEFQGRKWHGWTDGLTTWKPFRIPRNANSVPEYSDTEIKFDLALHAESIGMTGWDWEKQVSRWVAFDFDALIGHADKHSKKLNQEELDQIKQKTSSVDWVTIRRSTSGRGLHLYIFLDQNNPPHTANHNEHAALSRAILGKLSALTGYDFSSKVDICGGNMWVWSRRQGTDGLTLVKAGEPLQDIPLNWRDHVDVVSGKRRKNVPKFIRTDAEADEFEELCGQRTKITLEPEHQRVIDYLKEEEVLWWWDQDHSMLVTHTIHLKAAHRELGLKGFFETTSDASNLDEQNCFCFPIRGGSWSVRRYTPGVQEHAYWEQDGTGWTRCYLNRKPDLRSAARALGGLEDPKGGFIFREAEVAAQAAVLLGSEIKYDKAYSNRETKLKEHRDGRLVVQIERKEQDRADEMTGWLPDKKEWTKIYNSQVSEPLEADVGNYDDFIRHLVTESGEDCGWLIKSDSVWRAEPLIHLRVALGSMGFKNTEITTILGQSVINCWKLVNLPFQPEYPGDRQWNRNSAQFRFVPSPDVENLSYPTWKKILQHCGDGLTEALKHNGWAKANGILTGEDYLKCWIASMFQHPTQPLPYIFLYGEQNTGKSILHEALSLLLTKGYKRADVAITSQGGFNAELEGSILCIIEETDLRKNSIAYNRIKDWVTSREVLIHAKNKTPYHIVNTTHWLHCANDYNACPVFPGDTRITMCHVDPLGVTELIPKPKIIAMLEKEAPDFLAAILDLDIPESNDRLFVPVIVTEDKQIAQQLNKSPFELFLEEKCKPMPGAWIKFSDMFEQFQKTLDANDFNKWTKVQVGRSLPPTYPKGRNVKDGQFYIGNVAWRHDNEEYSGKYILNDVYLVKKEVITVE